MYFLFAPSAFALLAIFAISLHNHFVDRTNI